MKRFIIQLSFICGLSILALFSCKTEEAKETKEATTKPEGNKEMKDENAGTNAAASTSENEILQLIETFEKPDTLIAPPSKELENDKKLAYNFLKEQESYYWKSICFTEKSKFESVDRLLDEISYNPKHSYSDLKEARESALKLRTLFVPREEIDNSALVINDSINVALIQHIFAVSDSTPDIKNYPYVKQLKDEIFSLDESVVQLRSQHAYAIDVYNQFIIVNKEDLKALKIEAQPLSNWSAGEEL